MNRMMVTHQTDRRVIDVLGRVERPMTAAEIRGNLLRAEVD